MVSSNKQNNIAMKILNSFLILSLAFLFSSCDNCNKAKSDKNKIPDGQIKIQQVDLVQEWFANAGFAGELFTKYETGAKYGIDLNVIPGSDNINTIQLVLADKYKFGVASASKLFDFNQKNSELVIIGVINYKSLACFISKKDKDIHTPKDFEGKTVGTMAGTDNDLIYRALLKTQKVNVSKVKEVEAPYDLATFLLPNAPYDVRPAFFNDEPVTLDQKGIGYYTIDPNMFGVKFIGTCYFCKKSTLKNDPKLVQNFINALSEGWEAALKDPQKAISYLKQFSPDIDEKRELESLLKGQEYYAGENGKVLFASQERWESMGQTLVSLNLIKDYNVENAVNMNFVNWYQKSKQQ